VPEGGLMQPEFTQVELEAYLDESLDAARMSEIENQLRQRPALLERLAAVIARRDSGVHSLAEIWRRHQIGVPTREELGSYLLGVLPEEQAAYIRFRVEVLGCRYTIANLDDLRSRQSQAREEVDSRRRRYFQSSVGRLKE
jgi:hypothetical protein